MKLLATLAAAFCMAIQVHTPAIGGENPTSAGTQIQRTKITMTRSYKSSRAYPMLGKGISKTTVRKFRTSKSSARAAAPLAYQLLCLKSPKECRGGGKGTVQLTAASLAKIQSANNSVNRKIRAVSDKGADVWSANASQGDCEDFALAKRKKLIAMGVPAGALRLAVTKTRRGEGHAVLVVKTDKGDRILDNRTNSVRSWGQTDLRVIKIASANPLSWTSGR